MIAAMSLLLALAQPPAAAAPAMPREIAVATLAGSPDAEAALDRLLAELVSDGSVRVVRSAADASTYRSCLTSPGLDAWLVSACMFSALGRTEEGGRPLVALAVFDDRYGRRSLGCRGPDGDGGAFLREAHGENVWLRNRARAAIAHCFERASTGAGVARPAPEPGAPIRDLQGGQRFTGITIEDAQRTASDVVAIVVDEVHIPYQARSGICTVLGRVASVVRGSAFAKDSRLRAHFPCAAGGALRPPRWAQMHALNDNKIAMFYLAADGAVLDVEPDALCEADARGRGLDAALARSRCQTPPQYRR